ncbi:ras GEF [Hesseltinella vesiculosa]|uniref:Ras GEF n=1 Tax=Hesseltinella vesiculosa TaxID=101127 RepID=A0A1X2GC91_9FUNG|nr:ras GEF [Hesseltinella vesiculosa]
MQVEDDKSEAERTWYLHPQLNKSEIVYNSDGHLVGASLQVLIDMVTSHDRCPDALFIRSFFYNFRMFMEPLVLANMLKQRFNLSPPEHQDTHEPLTTEELELWQNDVRDPVRLRVYSVIKSWFEAYFDGAQDKEAARTLLPFVTSEMDLAMPVPARQMTELIELKLMTLTVSDTEVQNAICHSVEQAQDNQITLSPALIAAPCPSSTASTPIRNVFRLARLHHSHGPASTSTMASHATTSSRLTRIAVYRMDPQEIANQLTLMESTLFYAIPPSELIATQKKKSSTPVLHVRAMVHRSTLLVYWISNTILDELDTKARVHAIKFWIKACLQLNNFNTLMTIRCALNSASIARLKRTWDLAMRSTKYKTMYHTIDTVADSKRNFATYRKCLRQAVPPGLPFLGIFLSDMVFVDEGNLDLRFSTNGDLSLINFDKYVRMTQLLDQTIIRFQQVSYYKIKEIKEIQRYLLDCIESVNDNSEEQIYSKSLEIEPRIIDDD